MSQPVVNGSTNRGYFFKFEARGYLPYISRLVNAKEREATLDITLEPGSSQTLHVVDSGGILVPGVPVLFLNDKKFIFRTPAGFEYLRWRSVNVETDANGDVPLELDPGLGRILICCPRGSASPFKSDLAENGVVTLKPWGQVKGRVLRNEAPSSGELVMVVAPERIRESVTPLSSLLFDATTAKTDEQGRFTLTNVPPGESYLLVTRTWSAPSGDTQAVLESKTQIKIENATPIELIINLPQSRLSKADLTTK
ncbi:MAG TPA: hypothetical protein VGR78_07320 [Verrucomicrobiae bacterium]|nr:hypothetical protein [Verrucomicrobiae bacterium]